MLLEDISKSLIAALKPLRFGAPVSHVYLPLEYAWAPHARYLGRFGQGHKEVILVGMNPGPFGMAQTGVPFGDVAIVRDWMGIEEPVARPKQEHPKRPIEGFGCRRSEVSGSRLWGWARDTFGASEHFFARFFVHNYCPRCFMETSGRNFTPDKLPAAERAAVNDACGRALQRVVETLQPARVYGVGAFAETRARETLGHANVRIGRIPHPSPASPAANRGWAEQATKALLDAGLTL